MNCCYETIVNDASQQMNTKRIARNVLHFVGDDKEAKKYTKRDKIKMKLRVLEALLEAIRMYLFLKEIKKNRKRKKISIKFID